MASAENGSDDVLDGVKGAAEAVGKTAVAAALAGAVATGAAAVTPDQINLPDPVPIVQTADQGVDLPDSTVDDTATKKTSALKRFLQILKYVLLALFAVAAVVFAILGGIGSCAGSVAAPGDSSSSASSSSSMQEAA